jgi:ankyrin repeat protein
MFWRKKKPRITDDHRGTKEGLTFEGLLMHQKTLQGRGPSDLDSEGLALMHRFATHGGTEMLGMILEHGYNPDLKARANGLEGYTPLHFAALMGHVEIIDLLVEHGADVDSRSDGLNTPLQTAAYIGKPLALRALLSHGADPTVQDDLGKTALDYARERGHSAVVSLLDGSQAC